MRKEDAERELTRIPKAEPLVVERESKGRESILSLWKAFAYFHPYMKVSARPGTRGKALRQQNFLRRSATILIYKSFIIEVIAASAAENYFFLLIRPSSRGRLGS
ncbi:hypothetical protein [Clostridium merdae]|uniref:hypothetical protein n=1 Tax=Clostridium merdae TaxID=1958780 RepID=UPI00117D3853|nr:hypothetical protein [Clostridium merdae]